MSKRFFITFMMILYPAFYIVADTGPQGLWTGIVKEGEKKNPVQARLEIKNEALAGKITMPLERLFDVPLSEALMESDHISFSLNVDESILRFEGQWKEDSLNGVFTRDGDQGEFQMVRVTEVPASDYFGMYKRGENDYVYVRTWDELGENQLTFFDDAGKVGPLYAKSETRFFSGSGLWVPLPLKYEMEFTLTDHAATNLKWKNADSQKIENAPKITDFHEEEVQFESSGIKLAGTLYLPSGPGPHPAIVFVHGSGPVTRDFMGPLPYLFVRHGMAVLAYDKRGIGKSEGSWLEANFDQLSSDALSALGYLKNRPEIDHARIGMFGISQGGWLAPLAASRSGDVSFLIILSAPAVTPAEQQLMTISSEMKIAKVERSKIDEAIAGTKRQFETLRSEESKTALEASMLKLKEAGNQKLLDANSPENPKFLLFYRQILDYDPIPVLEKVKCPVYAIYGERDMLVPVAENKPKLETAFAKGGNGHVIVKILPGADHALLLSKTGSTSEFPSLSNFSPELFPTLGHWIELIKHQ